MNDKILSLMGICRKAGKITLGNDAVIESMQKHKAKLIIITSDVSKNTEKGVLSQAELHHTKIITVNRTKEEVGIAIGKYCAVVSIDDSGFANKLSKLISEENDRRIS